MLFSDRSVHFAKVGVAATMLSLASSQASAQSLEDLFAGAFCALQGSGGALNCESPAPAPTAPDTSFDTGGSVFGGTGASGFGWGGGGSLFSDFSWDFQTSDSSASGSASSSASASTQ